MRAALACLLTVLASASVAAERGGALDEPARAALRQHQVERAATLLAPPAAAGDADAAYLLGLIGLGGLGDEAGALAHLETAAEHGHAAAAYVLAAQWASRDEVRARHWLERAAALGDERARTDLAEHRLPLPAERDGGTEALGAFALYCARHDAAPALRELGRTALGARDAFGRDALAQAAAAGAPHAVETLLGLGADANRTDPQGVSELMIAAQTGNPDIVHTLLAAHASVNALDAERRSALVYALHGRQLPALEALLAAGADGNVTDARGFNAADIALGTADPALIARVRAAGIHPTLSAASHDLAAGHIDATRPGERYRGWSPLALAIARGDLTEAQALTRGGAHVNDRTPQGDTLLRVAIDAHAIDALRWLLANGADPAATDHAKLTALAYAATLEDGEALTALLAAHGVAAQADRALLGAVQAHLSANARRLLEAGARTDAADSLGRTPLMWAASAGQSELAKMLLSHGSTLGARDAAGRTALWYAAAAGADDIVGAILHAGAAPDLADTMGLTPLAAASAAGHLGSAQALLAAGARAQVADTRGNTPVMLAAAAGRAPLVSLLAGRSPVDQLNRDGDTALLLGARAGSSAVCTALLHAGADRKLRDRSHRTALDIARARGFTALAAELDTKG